MLRVIQAFAAMGSYSKQERRKFERRVTSVQLEVLLAGRTAPLRVATTDLSVGGCYILTVYPLPIGARVDITIPMGVEKLSVRGIVKTCHDTVGNGVQFLGMAPADRVKLESLLSGEPFLETESNELCDQVRDLAQAPVRVRTASKKARQAKRKKPRKQ